MMTNEELRHLNDLAARDDDALSALTVVLQESSIQGMDLAFGTGERPSPLHGHRLIGSSALLSMFAGDAYREVSGSGARYNGMWGDGAMLRDPRCAATLKVDRSPAPIGEQVVLCVRILGTSQVSLMPEMAHAVRRHLSGILLEYPVLMHPAFLVPAMRNGKTEYVSLASALATTSHGALPRYSHFHHPSLGPAEDRERAGARADTALVAKLMAFAKHPCLQQAYSSAAVRVHADASAVLARDRRVKTSRETLVRSMLGVTGQRVPFLASVMELDDLARRPGAQALRPFAAAVSGAAHEHLRVKLDSVMAVSLCAAAGMVHTASVTGMLPDEMRAFTPDMEFLQAIRARSGQLFSLDSQKGSLPGALASSMQWRVFLGRQDTLTPEELAHNARNLSLALALCGFMPSTADAARFVLDTCVGRMRNEGRLPRTDAAGAIAFMEAIGSLGGLGSTDEGALEAVVDVSNAIQEVPDHPVPYRDDWVQGLQVLHAEKTMLTVLARAAAQAAPGSSDDVVDPAPVARRRARAAL